MVAPRLLTALVLLGTLAATTVGAEDAPAEAPVVYERDARALTALQTMGSQLRAIKRFEIDAQSTTDQVLDTGQTLQFAHRTRLKAELPNKLQITVDDHQHSKSLYYDGKHFVLYGSQHNAYSKLPAPASVADLLTQLQDNFGIQLPLADLFYWGTEQAPLDEVKSALYIGDEQLGEQTCTHYAYRQEGVDWQLWLRVGDQPLPCQVLITDLSDEARPQHRVRLQWNLQPTFDAATFSFIPPSNAQPVSLVPRQTESSPAAQP
ncbi:DUF2092 domain-containing protein [Pseudomonas sp. GV071]|uniref:DUF2092 domain-containing protein n=1 Tax=Pseudomonas sp. GV071 TaxID=2135754 RepID=UPI000D34F604|nr:DUF2092 domain-containing protein [Pseudomonas sp. GV071]PTQ68518.1 hypothetical protein C8K61_111147 [Pseudomonas sp. GV071]